MIDEFEIGKIYKLNTVLSTDGKMLHPGVIITVLDVQERRIWSRLLRDSWEKQMRVTFLHDNKIMSCQDYGYKLLTYFNEIKET